MLDFSEKDIDKLITGIYSGDVTPGKLPDKFYKATKKKLSEGVEKAYTGIEFGEVDPLLKKELLDNVSFFSSAKTFQQTLDMSDAIIGSDGAIVPFSQFKETAKMIYKKYNGTAGAGEMNMGYLSAEYDTAIANGQNAQKWNQIIEDSAALPFLRYNAVGDGLLCEICRPFNGIVLPVGSPVWKTIGPSNHFRCRCVLEQLSVDSAKFRVSSEAHANEQISKSKITDEFKYNPGEAKEIFSTKGKSKHPYFTVPRKYINLARNNFNLEP